MENMRWLVTADIHASDRPKDAYRFGLFDWLAKQQQKHNTDATFILGDLTDRKDNHSSSLVNRLIDELLKLKPPIYILRGNHDGIDPSNPFFRFLSTIEGIDFVVEPTVIRPFDQYLALIPHQPNQAALDHASGIVTPKMPGVFMHQTFDGALAETGRPLSGLSAPLIEARQPLTWLSGDVHKPQTLKCGLTYVGAPYHVRFGDNYEPRVLLVGNTMTDLHFPCLKKWVVHMNSQSSLWVGPKAGDHVKIIVTLSPEEVVEWAAIKRGILDACRKMEVQVFGIELDVETAKAERGKHKPTGKSSRNVFNAFCQSEKVADNIKQVGEEFVSN